LKPGLHIGESCGCKPPLEKTICWERVIISLEGANNLIHVPPPELVESYQNFNDVPIMSKKENKAEAPLLSSDTIMHHAENQDALNKQCLKSAPLPKKNNQSKKGVKLK
jgi:hypothetical protein